MFEFLEYKLQKSNINISYYNIFHKYSPSSKKNIYLSHIICHDILDFSQVSQLYRAQKEAAKLLVKSDLLVSKDNSVLYIIWELKKGIRFMFDRKIFNKLIKCKKDIDSAYNIILGGLVILTPDAYNNKNIKEIVNLKKFFNVDYKIAIVNSLSQAFKIIEKFN
jgi:hypothetical protein